jgi:hypothetical protein
VITLPKPDELLSGVAWVVLTGTGTAAGASVDGSSVTVVAALSMSSGSSSTSATTETSTPHNHEKCFSIKNKVIPEGNHEIITVLSLKV